MQDSADPAMQEEAPIEPQSAPTPPKKPRNFGGCILLLVMAGMATSFVVTLWVLDWKQAKPIRSSGGLWFPGRHVIPVPHFSQNDPRWAKQNLGPTDGSFGSEGCAVTSAAMVLASYGHEISPGDLNEFLTENEGYTDRGWLYWEKAADFPGVNATKAYEDLPSFHLIDKNLREGNPVIVRVRYKSGITHFVVICGKEGYRYLVMDPAIPGQMEPVPLKDYFPKIEALRFYDNGKL